MRTFTHSPHLHTTTMTIAELRSKLADYPDDMPVLFEWEGQRLPACFFSVEVYPAPDHPDACDCLVIDVNQRS